MENIIRHLDDLIRKTSESIYYDKIKEYDIAYNISRYISGKKNVDLFKDITDELLKKKYLEIVEENNIFNIDFLKKVCRIKEYILSNYQLDLDFYCDENVKLLLKKDKKLYDSVLDDSIICENT